MQTIAPRNFSISMRSVALGGNRSFWYYHPPRKLRAAREMVLYRRDPPMRICLYTSTALPALGGQEVVVDTLARQFLERGHQVVVLAPRPTRPWRLKDHLRPYPVFRHPRFYSTRHLVSWYGWWMVRLHRQRRFDILHAHDIYPTGYVVAANRNRLPVPLVLTAHGADSQDNPRLAKHGLRERYEAAVRQADALVAISRYTRQSFVDLQPGCESRIAEIPNGVDLNWASATATRPKDLDARIQPDRYLLYLGRLHEQKGVDVLLRAFARAGSNPARAAGTSDRADNGDEFQLVIAGDGGRRKAWEELAQTLGIARRVHFLGMTTGNQKKYLLQNSRCLVAPSQRFETFGIVVLESFACGRGAIVSRLPGLADLVDSGRTGLLTEPGQVEELAGALKEAMNDSARWAARGMAARTAAQQYCWNQIAARHLDLYRSLVAARATQSQPPGHRAPQAA